MIMLMIILAKIWLASQLQATAKHLELVVFYNEHHITIMTVEV